MRRIIVILLIVFSIPVYSQSEQLPGLEAYFSAIIVKDIDTSIAWYSNALGFEIQNKNESKDRGFRQANLKCGNVLLELIELDQAVSPQDVIPNYSSRTFITGLFKIGFLVTDFQKWMDNFTKEGVDFNGNVVTDEASGKRMVIIKDPDGNRIQFFEK